LKREKWITRRYVTAGKWASELSSIVTRPFTKYKGRANVPIANSWRGVGYEVSGVEAIQVPT